MIIGMDFGTTNSGMAVYDGRFYLCCGGWWPVTSSTRRKLTTPERFSCNVFTVALPVAVKPIINVKSSFQAK
jgi:hypothetical protein